MSRVTVEPRMAATIKRLKKLQDRIEDPAPILQEVGDTLRKTTVSRFFAQTSPTGKRWKRSKAARRKRRLTLVRTGDLRDSFRVVQSGGKVEVGTDLYYARIHQQGGPIDAKYKAKGSSRGSASFKLPSLPNLKPGASSAVKLARSAFQRQRRKTARNVKLPARKFLGVSKRDRKRTTKILIDKLSEAMS